MPPSLGIFVGMAVLLRGESCGVDACWPAGDTTFSTVTWLQRWSSNVDGHCYNTKRKGEEQLWRRLQALQPEEYHSGRSKVLLLSGDR